MRNEYKTMIMDESASDEELMRQLAIGSRDALGPLYQRYARLIFHFAAKTLDRAAAEDIVQDVFLAVWRRAGTFDPERGAFRPWVLQIAHFRILNELRRHSRQPQVEPDPEGTLLADLPDDSPALADSMWQEYRRSVLRSAFAELSPLQQRALGLAFFEDLTHEQVASTLRVPLGTAKTRIRDGLQKLRGSLAPLSTVLTVILLTLLVVRYRVQWTALQRHERALALVTASDTENLRLAPVPGVATDTHARYRGRTGTALAVLTLSHFPLSPTGQTYQVWVRHHGIWTSLGTVQPDTTGSARLVAEDPTLTVLPEEIQITVEPVGGSATPSESVVVAWPEERGVSGNH
ncbi:MAG: sigma-70 family RNA polymerase sigma factor [Candidatus Binatia bacterium]